MNKLVIPTVLKKKYRLLNPYGDDEEDIQKEMLVIDRWTKPLTLERVITLIDKVPFVRFKKRGEIRSFKSLSRLVDENKFIRLMLSINHSSRGSVVVKIGQGYFDLRVNNLSTYSWRGKKITPSELEQVRRIQREASYTHNILKIKDLDTLTLLVKQTCRGLTSVTFFFTHCTVMGSVDDMIFCLYDVDPRYKDKIHKQVKSAGLYLR